MNLTVEGALLNGVNQSVSEFTSSFGYVDYSVLIFILSVSLGIGFFFYGDSSKSTEEYLLGGRKMKVIPIAISLIASQLSGMSIMAHPAEIYVYGIKIALIVPVMIFVVVVINSIFLPVFYNNHIGNCYEYLEMRFSKPVKNLITMLYIINVLLICPVALFIPALALAQVTGFNLHLINVGCVIICVVYTMMGGIKAVVWTDVVQGTVMLGSTILSVIYGVAAVGGLGKVFERSDQGGRLNLFDMTLDLTTRQTFWNISFGYLIMWAAYVGLNQSCIQRIVSLPSISHAKRAMIIFGIGFFLITALNSLLGLVMYAKYSRCDPLATGEVSKPDKMVPHFVQDTVGHISGLTGVFVSCVFSAGLSTMSANLNSLAGLLYEDYIRPSIKLPTDRKANNIMRLIIVLCGLYCALMGIVVENFSSILQLVMTISSVQCGTTFGAFCLGMLWPYANKHGAMWGSVAGSIVSTILVIGSQLKLMNNEIIYPILSSSVEECPIVPSNFTTWIESHSVPKSDEGFSIFNIAFPWLSVISTVFVLATGMVVSKFTGGYDISRTGTKLISPVAHRLVPKEVREVELKELKTRHADVPRIYITQEEKDGN